MGILGLMHTTVVDTLGGWKENEGESETTLEEDDSGYNKFAWSVGVGKVSSYQDDEYFSVGPPVELGGKG